MTATEQSIIESAKILFIKNGYRGTSMREIAIDAKVNLAMLNYYFRSKDNLFELIFREAFEMMSCNVISALSSTDDNTLEKVAKFVDVYVNGLIKNPAIPSFIFQEVLNNPQRLSSQFKDNKEFESILSILVTQLKEDAEKGLIIPIENPLNLFLDITSLCVFPFIIKPIVEAIAEVGDDIYMQIIENRKSEIITIMHNYLKA